MDIQSAVVERLNRIIKEKGMNVNETAVKSKVPPSTLKNILYGKTRNMGIVTLMKLCEGLGISISEFFDDDLFK